MADILDSLAQTDEWESRMAQDPRANQASETWERVMEKVKAVLPFELCEELGVAHSGEVSACEDAGILYGLYVAMEIQKMAASPQIVQSQYLARQEAAR